MDTSHDHHNRMHRPRSILGALLAAAGLVGSLLLFSSSTTDNDSDQYQYSFRFQNNDNNYKHSNRQLSAAVRVAQFDDPKSVSLRTDVPGAGAGGDEGLITQLLSDEAQPHIPSPWLPIDEESRQRCQIVYLMGVEGATHHGIVPILETLAKAQLDENGIPYSVEVDHPVLKSGLFGWGDKGRIKTMGFAPNVPLSNPDFVQRIVKKTCPNDGKKHILIEWASFPSGQQDDPRSYRVHRQHDWLSMTPQEIANDSDALNQPLNVTEFVHAYSPLVDIKFVVLHRPFLETIASHHSWDGGAESHSNIIRGFMLLLRKFLDNHPVDMVSGKRLWQLLCVERIMAKNYDNPKDVDVARSNIVANMANFLGWSNGECSHCFDKWYESKKDPRNHLGEEKYNILTEHMKLLEGVWPPPGEEGVVEQQCGI